MTKRFPATRQVHFQGQILLERALFCVGCEIIFTGTTRCPRCSSLEAVWPLAEWLRSAREAAVTTLHSSHPLMEGHSAPRPRPAAQMATPNIYVISRKA
jgi:hypothetical protein